MISLIVYLIIAFCNDENVSTRITIVLFTFATLEFALYIAMINTLGYLWK